MSLFKQLLLAICLFLLVAFGGSFLVGLESSREQYVNQLRSHAQDAATALGLSLASNIDDPAMIELMVSSIFDSGYYASIRVVDLASGNLIVERSGAPDLPSVPAWFVRLIGLEPAAGDAIVSRGWEQAARVEVVSHPLFAVARLWRNALGSLAWLAACGLASCLLGAFLLRRQLRPLDYLVEQSQAIARREFLSLPNLPRTPELRRVVQAMNQMAEKLKTLFQEQALRSEKLREEAYQDSLTGLANRRYFDMQLQNRLGTEEQASHGYLLLLRVNDLAGMNARLGGQRTDRLLAAIGELLRRQIAPTHSDLLIARTRGGEFALLVPGLLREEAERLATGLQRALASLHATGAADVLPVATMGLAPFGPASAAATLLSQADEALTRAEAQTERCWALLEHAGEPRPGDDPRGWHARLDQALLHKRFQLFFQPVVDSRETGRVLHYKVLSRLLDEEGRLIPAGRFLSWIERFGWSCRLDLVMLELVLAQMAGHDQSLALNLSGATLEDSTALDAVLEKLARHRELGARLTLELEEGRLPDQAALERLNKRLRELGFSLSLQHFGGRFSMIGNLARLGLAWLKVDGGYIRDIDQENHKRLFIEAIQRAANSIDLPLIAERVETEGELQVLREMGIHGVQGRLFGEPGPWK